MHQILSLEHDWSKDDVCLIMRQLKLSNIPVIFPTFEIQPVAAYIMLDTTAIFETLNLFFEVLVMQMFLKGPFNFPRQ